MSPVLVNPSRFAPVSVSYSAAILADSPLVYWRLGESSGTTAADSSGNSRNGTYTNSPTLGVTGALTSDTNKAVQFDGANDYVTIAGASWQNVSDYTIELWFKSSAATANAWLASRDNGVAGAKIWDVALNNGTADGKLMFATWSSPSGVSTFQSVSSSAGGHNDGNWHHLACVKSGTSMLLYLDGALDNSGTYSAFDTSSTIALYLARRGNNTNFFPGSIDEFAFYGTALSASRIAAHYAAR